MNVIKFFHHSKWPYRTLAVACLCYALFSFYKLVVKNKTPFKIQADGIVLDSTNTYYFTNYNNARSQQRAGSKNSILIRYKKNKKWMPNHIATLYYNKGWKLKLDKAVHNPIKTHQPFLPYCRSIKKAIDGRFKFYSSSKILTESELQTGLIFNYPTGSVTDREYLRIDGYANKKVLYFEDDGIGVSYKLPDFKSRISVVFNTEEKKLDRVSNFILRFDDTSPTISDTYQIIYDPHYFLSTSVDVKDKQGRSLYSNSNTSNATFQIENILFSLKINQKYGLLTVLLFFVHIALISGFLFYFIQLKPPAFNNPIQSSIVKSRIIMNCLILLGTALFIKTFGYYQNTISYDCTLFLFPYLFNVSYFFVPLWKRVKKLSFPRKERINFLKRSKYPDVLYVSCLFFFFILIPVLIRTTNIVSNERIFGVPALHFQKILIILAYFVFSSDLVSEKTGHILKSIKPGLVKKYFDLLPKNVLILLFSLLLSAATGDFGSVLFVAIAILMIEITLRRIQLKSVLVGIGLGFIFLIFLNQIQLFDYRKLYRFLYSFFPPDSKNFAHFNQADRETISYLWFNLKSFLESFHWGLFNDLKIPEVAKSVAHSDYAFHWSLMLGGIPFIVLLLSCLILLLTHLFFVFKSTLVPMKIGKNTFLRIVKSRYTIIISFWLAITILQFVYQLCSNNMLIGSVLSGIPMPFISVGRGDYVFITFLIVGLEILFYSNSFKADSRKENANFVLCNKVFKSSFSQSQYLLLAFLLLFGFKKIQFNYFDENKIKIEQQVSDKDEKDIILSSNGFNSATQKKYIQLAKNEINGNDLTNLPLKVKDKLKPLQYAYYKGKPIKKAVKIPFVLSQERLSEIISWKNHFNFRKREISGNQRPFGRVYAKSVLINDHYETIISNPYYSHLNLNNDILNTDLSAELNQLLESYILHNMPKNTKASVVVLNNKQNEFEATSQFPNDSNDFVYDQGYFIGSVKKAILLDAALNIDYEKYINYKSRGFTLGTWIKYSDYEYAGDLLSDILNNNFERFNHYLSKEYNMPFYSISLPSYSDRPKENVTNIPLLANGGFQKYGIASVLHWYRKIVLKANKKGKRAHELKRILNLPLHTYGTADMVGNKLRNLNIGIKGFIAKTGTLEEDGKNISSSFIIADQDYTIGVMMVSNNLPSNHSGLTAKYFFKNKILPLLLSYSVLN